MSYAPPSAQSLLRCIFLHTPSVGLSCLPEPAHPPSSFHAPSSPSSLLASISTPASEHLVTNSGTDYKAVRFLCRFHRTVPGEDGGIASLSWGLAGGCSSSPSRPPGEGT